MLVLNERGPSGFGVDCDIFTQRQNALTPYRNASLAGRWCVSGRCVIKDGLAPASAIARF